MLYWQKLTTPQGQTFNGARLVTLEIETANLALARIGQTIPILGIAADAYLAQLYARTDIIIDDVPGFEVVRTIVFDQPLQGVLDTPIQADQVLGVTGHSLGGHLATALTRLVPGIEAVGINGAGFATGSIPGLGGDAVLNIRNLFSLLNGAEAFDSSRICNLYGDKMPEFVTMNSAFGLQQQGSHECVFIEPPSLFDDALGHGVKQMVDSLSLYHLFTLIDDTLDLDLMNLWLSEASNNPAYSLEEVLNKLGDIFVVDNITQVDHRESFYQQITDICQKILESGNALEPVLKPAYQGLQLVITDMLEASAEDSSPQGLAYRYALKELNPFAVVGMDYGAHNPNGELDLYDPLMDQGQLTSSWLSDRASMLEALLLRNGTDNTDTTMAGEDILYHDVASGTELRYGSLLTSDENRVHVEFGSDDADVLNGRAKADRLYGGAGNDTLTGNGSNDYLEGGTGFDTYYAGVGNDIIFDTDGQGKVFFGTTLLDGGANVQGGWLSRDDKFTYTMAGNDLLIQPKNGSAGVYIKDFENGDLAILLGNQLTTDPARVDRVFGSSGNDIINSLDEEDVIIAGDGNDIIHAGTGNDFVWGELGNDILHGEYGLDYLNGEQGNDQIYGGKGADLIEGAAGNDTLYADNGPGDLALPTASGQGDWLNGGVGNDALFGSARADFLAGGAGKDTLHGGAGDDVLTGDGDYQPFYPPWYIEVVSLTALQMQIELGALMTTIAGMPDLLMEAIYTLSQLQSGETFLPPSGSGRVGADWTCHAPTTKYPRGYWERSAPTYQMSPKPEAHAWTVTFNENGSFTLAPQLARDASQFVAAAAGGAADYLEGGQGNDALYGGVGDDVYHFNSGDGVDSVHDSLAEGNNVLSFGADIQKEDIHVSEYGGGLRIDYGNQGDAILLDGAGVADTVFRSVRLADGTEFDFSDLLLPPAITGSEDGETLLGDAEADRLFGLGGNDTLRAGEGNDVLDGGEDNDVLYAGRGDDVLRGGEGNDKLYGERGDDVLRGGQGNDTLYDVAGDETYYFALGDGADTLLDTQGDDTLVFEGIDYTDLVFAKSANARSLEISVQGTDDKVTVTDWFLNESRQIEHIQAGDYELDGAEVLNLIGALADYVPPPLEPETGGNAVPFVELIGNYWQVA
ncbi:MAG: hypothetical protein LBP58_00480 [Azoarcus sp.]|nr:hypothetical protein [Azoarcus sp.]